MNLWQAFPEFKTDGTVALSAPVGDGTVGHARVDAYSGLLTLTGIKPGVTWVTLQECSAQKCSLLNATTFRLIVRPSPNMRPQVVGSVADQQVHVGESVTVAVSPAFWDLEDDPIVGYWLHIEDDEVATETMVSPGGRISIQGSRVGATSVVVSACDSGGCGTDELTLSFNLEVLPARNHPPEVIAEIADRTIHQGETIELNLGPLFSDPEGDPIRDYGLSQTDRSIAIGSVAPDVGLLTITGAKVGATVVSVDARDSGSGISGSPLSFKLTVTEPRRNPPRVIGAISDRTLELGGSVEVPVAHAFSAPPRYRIIRYDFLINDTEVATDGDISRSGILKLRGEKIGKSWISVRACSYAGCSDFTELAFVLIVVDSDAEPNRSPEVVGAVADRFLKVGESVTLDVSKAFTDPDSDRIVDYHYELSDPSTVLGSSITNTGILMLRGSSAGETKVSVYACDDEHNCSEPDDLNFRVTVGYYLSQNR